jgi:hypothetical protein
MTDEPMTDDVETSELTCSTDNKNTGLSLHGYPSGRFEKVSALHLPIHINKYNRRPLTLPECLVCRSSVMHYERNNGTIRRLGRHCAKCHSRTHSSCVVCIHCLPERARSDRLTCSSRCRQQAYRWRHWKETRVEFMHEEQADYSRTRKTGTSEMEIKIEQEPIR